MPEAVACVRHHDCFSIAPVLWPSLVAQEHSAVFSVCLSPIVVRTSQLNTQLQVPCVSPEKASSGGLNVCVETIHRELPGPGRRLLGTGSDGCLYLIKPTSADYSAEKRTSEAFAATLAAYLGLPVVAWHPIALPRRSGKGCADALPDCAEKVTCSSYALHFACRIPRHHCKGAYEILSRRWLPRVVKRAEFLSMALFDLRTMNLRPRKALFTQQSDGQLTATFIEHSDCLCNSGLAPVIGPERVLYRDRRMYEGLGENGETARFLTMIQSVDIAAVQSCLDLLPGSWVTEQCRDRIASNLLRSQIRLPSLAHTLETDLCPQAAKFGSASALSAHLFLAAF